MSDVSYLSERVAPHSIRFSQLTPLAFQAKSSKRIYYTTNNSTYTQDNNVIQIPISSGTAMLDAPNSFLKFTVKNTTGGAKVIRFNNSAHSLIQRLTIRADSTGSELEDINYYHQIHAALSDLMLSPEKRFSRGEQCFGNKGVFPATADIAAYTRLDVAGANLADAITSVNAELTKVRASLQNAQVGSANYGSAYLGCDEVTIADGITQTVVLPLDLSSLLGPNAKKMLPLFLSGGVLLELTLNKYPFSTTDGTAIKYEVGNVEMHCELCEFDANVNQALTSMTAQSGLYIHGTRWKGIMTPLSANTTTLQISERLKSVKSLFFHFCDSANNTNTNAKRITARHNNTLNQFQLKIGSEFYPNYPVRGASDDAKGNSEYIAETLKALGQYSNVMHSQLVNNVNFADNTNAAATCGRSVFGLNLDCFPSSDVESGVSTIVNNPIQLQFQQTTPAAMDCYVYMLHDCIFEIRPDGKFLCSK